MKGPNNTELKPHHRFWTCPKCGTEHDRDENAAINIREYEYDSTGGSPETALPNGLGGRGTPVEIREALVSRSAQEELSTDSEESRVPKPSA